MRFISSRSSGLYSITSSCVSTSIPSANSVLRSMAGWVSCDPAESVAAGPGPVEPSGMAGPGSAADGAGCLPSTAVPHAGQNLYRSSSRSPQPVQNTIRLRLCLFYKKSSRSAEGCSRQQDTVVYRQVAAPVRVAGLMDALSGQILSQTPQNPAVPACHPARSTRQSRWFSISNGVDLAVKSVDEEPLRTHPDHLQRQHRHAHSNLRRTNAGLASNA